MSLTSTGVTREGGVKEIDESAGRRKDDEEAKGLTDIVKTKKGRADRERKKISRIHHILH